MCKHNWSWDCNNEDFYCIKCGKVLMKGLK